MTLDKQALNAAISKADASTFFEGGETYAEFVIRAYLNALKGSQPTPAPVEVEPVAWRYMINECNKLSDWYLTPHKPDWGSANHMLELEPLYSQSTLQEEVKRLRDANDSYTFIGSGGKAILAKDLQARAEAAEARVSELETVLKSKEGK